MTREASVGLQLAVDHDRHSIHDCGVHPLRLGRPSRGAVGEVMGEHLLVGTDGVGIEDHHVSGVAGQQQASIREPAQRGRDRRDLSHPLFEREPAPLTHPVLQEPGVGLGPVISVEVGATIRRADDHVWIVLRDLGALDPLGGLGLPEELDREIFRGRDVEERIGGVDPPFSGDVQQGPTDELLVRGGGHLVHVQHRPGGGRQGGARSGLAVGPIDRIAHGVAEGRVGDQCHSLVDGAGLGEDPVELQRAFVQLGAGGQVERAVERLRHGHRVHRRAAGGGVVDEALGVVPAGCGGIDLGPGTETLDDHRHPREERHLDEQLLIVGGDPADGGAWQGGDRAAPSATRCL